MRCGWAVGFWIGGGEGRNEACALGAGAQQHQRGCRKRWQNQPL